MQFYEKNTYNKMTSSSIILSNILASESSELKSTIDSYMDTNN